MLPKANQLKPGASFLRFWCAWWLTSFPFFVLLLFLGAMFWAKSQDPFSRRWFTLKTADHGSFHCVAVLPKPVRRCPVVVYAHGAGGSLMEDGNDLRQMAELGLAVMSLDYNETNGAVFKAQWAALILHLSRQPWADTNAVAWVGFSLGAERTLDSAQSGSGVTPVRPQFLVQISGPGLPPTPNPQTPNPQTPNPQFHCPALLLHGDQDEIFPVADTRRLADCWQNNGVPVTLQILTGLSHNLDPERAVVFRRVGEACLTNLVGPDAWRNYHSIAQWQAEGLPLWVFWLPAMGWVGRWVWKRKGEKQKWGKQKAEMGGDKAESKKRERDLGAERGPQMADERGWDKDKGGEFLTAKHTRYANKDAEFGPQNTKSAESIAGGEIGAEAAEVRRPNLRPTGMERFGRRTSAVLPWLAAILATAALADSAVHLVPPHFPVSGKTLALARRFLVQPKERADFELLAAQPIWSGVTLRVLLDHVELAGYNRELINWTLSDDLYRGYVLEPGIIQKQKWGEQKSEIGDKAESRKLKAEMGGEKGESREQKIENGKLKAEDLDWRRMLWEEFYPRIRHESSPEEAARVVVRHLQERLTVTRLAEAPRTVPDIWRRQITDATGFEIITVAALRSAGVPARLNAAGEAEFCVGSGVWGLASGIRGGG